MKALRLRMTVMRTSSTPTFLKVTSTSPYQLHLEASWKTYSNISKTNHNQLHVSVKYLDQWHHSNTNTTNKRQSPHPPHHSHPHHPLCSSRKPRWHPPGFWARRRSGRGWHPRHQHHHPLSQREPRPGWVHQINLHLVIGCILPINVYWWCNTVSIEGAMLMQNEN